MKTFMYLVMFGYLLPAFIIYLFETFVPAYNKAIKEIAQEDSDSMWISEQTFKDLLQWLPIFNFIAVISLFYHGIKYALFPPDKCTTCGREKNDPNGRFCSNSFHLRDEN